MGAQSPVLPEGWPHTGRRPTTCQPTRRIWWSDERRARFEQMWRDDVDVEEMADFFETDTKVIYGKAGQWKLGRRRRKAGGNPGWPEEKRARFREMWNGDQPVPDIAQEMGTSRGAVYQRARGDDQCKKRAPGISGRRRRVEGDGRTRVRNGASFRTLPGRDVTKQRRFTGFKKEDDEGPRIILEPHHPAHRKGTTFFPGRVLPAAKVERLLKSGEHSRKLGKMVTKGRWKGFPIVSLTLEERETCPRTCQAWAICYGNNMPFAIRVLDDGTLTKRLWGELASLAARHPAGFVVRLHVLGDFYSREYVAFWAQALRDFPALNVFGFTARAPSEPIGGDLVRLVAANEERFVIRFSGAGYETHCAEVVDHPEHATGIRCPAETDENRCCATCGVCWGTTRTISFVKH